jgi:hypothetical protein
MLISIRPFRRFSIQCSITTHGGDSKDETPCGTSRLPVRDCLEICPCAQGGTLSLTITLPNEERIEVPQAIVRWSRGQEFTVENVLVERRTHARLQHYVKGLVQELTEIAL